MSDAHEQLIERLTLLLTQRESMSANAPALRTTSADFVSLLRDHLERSKTSSWCCVVVADTDAPRDTRRTAALTPGVLQDFALRLRCGGFMFDSNTSEQDLLGWSELSLESRAGIASFAIGSGLLRQKTASIRASPPVNTPGWFGTYDAERDGELSDSPARPMGSAQGGSCAGSGGSATPGRGGGVGSGSGGAGSLSGGTGGAGAGPGAVGTCDASTDASSAPAALAPSTAQTLRRMLETVEVAHERASQGHSIDIAGARDTAEDLVRTSVDSAHDVLREVQYTNYDSYTLGHSVRVALLAVLVGRRLGLSERALIELGTAGLLHDVGKARIAREILFKPGRLDADERLEMSRHPALGAEILIEQRDAGPLSVGAAFGHHLRHDGVGYPAVPSWFRRGTATAIVQVCDVFEALTAVRPYKAALSPRRAFEVMIADESAFHPAALSALVRSMGIYPPGTRVRLSSGAKGVVLRAGLDLARPIVRLTHTEEGRELVDAEQSLLDFAHATMALEILGAERSVPEHRHEPGAEAECCR